MPTNIQHSVEKLKHRALGVELLRHSQDSFDTEWHLIIINSRFVDRRALGKRNERSFETSHRSNERLRDCSSLASPYVRSLGYISPIKLEKAREA